MINGEYVTDTLDIRPKVDSYTVGENVDHHLNLRVDHLLLLEVLLRIY